MTKQEKVKRIKADFATWWGLAEDAFEQDKNIIVEKSVNIFFQCIHFGGNAVFKVDKAILEWCKEKFGDAVGVEIFDGETLGDIQAKLHEYGESILGQDYYFARLNEGMDIERPEGVSIELYEKDRLASLYDSTDEKFPHALDYDERHEEFALLAWKGGKIIGIASCHEASISVDVLVEFRGCGLASYLTKEIALEIEKRGDVPVYITWSDNIASVRTAINAGFVPIGSWVWTNHDNVHGGDEDD